MQSVTEIRKMPSAARYTLSAIIQQFVVGVSALGPTDLHRINAGVKINSPYTATKCEEMHQSVLLVKNFCPST